MNTSTKSKKTYGYRKVLMSPVTRKEKARPLYSHVFTHIPVCIFWWRPLLSLLLLSSGKGRYGPQKPDVVRISSGYWRAVPRYWQHVSARPSLVGWGGALCLHQAGTPPNTAHVPLNNTGWPSTMMYPAHTQHHWNPLPLVPTNTSANTNIIYSTESKQHKI